MADIYVRSTDGSDADNGSTWALAKATLAGAAAIDAAGDRIFLASTHSESTAGALAIALAGTGVLPTLVASVDDSAEPPAASAAGALVGTTGSSTISFTGAASFLISGLTVNAGVGGTSTASITITPSTAGRGIVRNCTLRIAATGANSRMNMPGGASKLHLENTTVRFAAAAQAVTVSSGGVLIWDGGGVEAGSSANTVMFAGLAGQVQASGLDLSACASTLTIFTGAAARGGGSIRNSRLPDGWTGSLATGVGVGDRYEMHNCDSGDTNYRLWVEEYGGSVRSETTIVRGSGATDGAVPFSWRMAGNANAEFPANTVTSPEITVWNSVVGSPVTVTVEVVTDGYTLKDDDCWLEVQYLGTSGFPRSLFASDEKADVVAAGASQDSSTAAWTTTGLTTPVRQKLSVTFTPQGVGYLQAVVKLAKPSTTVYVDPLLTVA